MLSCGCVENVPKWFVWERIRRKKLIQNNIQSPDCDREKLRLTFELFLGDYHMLYQKNNVFLVRNELKSIEIVLGRKSFKSQTFSHKAQNILHTVRNSQFNMTIEIFSCSFWNEFEISSCLQHEPKIICNLGESGGERKHPPRLNSNQIDKTGYVSAQKIQHPSTNKHDRWLYAADKNCAITHMTKGV